MTQSLVGYKLVDSNNAIIQSWGGTWGQSPSIPDVIALPNGNQVHCPAVGGTYGNWTLIAWMMDPPTPTIADISAAAVIAGLNITSTGTPSLNGTYAVDLAARGNIVAIMSGIASGQGLPGSNSTFAYFDMTGTPHILNVAQITSISVAIRDYVYALDLYGVGAGALPSANVTIA